MPDHSVKSFEPGAAAISNLLEKCGYSPSPEQAKALWLEAKAVFDQSEHDWSESIQEIVESGSESLDTLIRDDLKFGVALALTGLEWPINSDSEVSLGSFKMAFDKALTDRGIKE